MDFTWSESRQRWVRTEHNGRQLEAGPPGGFAYDDPPDMDQLSLICIKGEGDRSVWTYKLTAHDRVPYKQAKAELVAKLTPEWLQVLVDAARIIGWGVDYVEVDSFVCEVFYLAGQKPPSAVHVPYQPEEE